jgi:hypothetical protein
MKNPYLKSLHQAAQRKSFKRMARLVVGAALAAAIAWSASYEVHGLADLDSAPAACSTDTECETQCRADLRPDENESLCDVVARSYPSIIGVRA